MKTSLALFCAFALTTLAACGDDGLKPGTDGGEDQGVPDMTAQSDMSVAPPRDLTGLAGVTCGNQTCGMGQSCCVMAAGQSLSQMCITGDTCNVGADGGIAVDATCDGPEDCSGSTSNCCASFSLGGGSPTGGAMCTATCTASAAAGGGGGGDLTTKLCHSAADCTNYSGSTPLGTLDFDSCCSYTGIAYKFCAPGIISGFAMGVTCQ